MRFIIILLTDYELRLFERQQSFINCFDIT
jgi:hypothetical protein